MKKIIYISLFLFFSCSIKKEKINHLDVLFIERGLTSQIPLTCDKLNFHWNSPIINRIKINDNSFNSKFLSLIKQYKKSHEVSSCDIRIKILIHYTYINKVDTLCLGENFCTYFNGKRVLDSQKLLKLVKDYIYTQNLDKHDGADISPHK